MVPVHGNLSSYLLTFYVFMKLSQNLNMAGVTAKMSSVLIYMLKWDNFHKHRNRLASLTSGPSLQGTT